MYCLAQEEEGPGSGPHPDGHGGDCEVPRPGLPLPKELPWQVNFPQFYLFIYFLKNIFFSGGTDEGRKKNEVFVTDFVYANPVKLLFFCGKSGK